MLKASTFYYDRASGWQLEAGIVERRMTVHGLSPTTPDLMRQFDILNTASSDSSRYATYRFSASNGISRHSICTP